MSPQQSRNGKRSRAGRSPAKRGDGSRPGGRKIRYAVLGQGYFSQVAVLPAFEHAAENSELVALVSDDPVKLKELGKKYRVDHTLSYEECDRFFASGEVDAVYIALPNHLHREFTVRAARAGVHVLCEKPMAVTERDCEVMIRETDRNRVKLMIAYRLHFEEANLEAVKITTSGKLGDVRIFNSTFTMQVEEGNIRLNPIEQGGGTLYDIGIYCINAARYLLRDEPSQVVALSANNGEPRFRNVDEMTSAVMRFPDERLASFTSSFGAASVSAYHLIGTKGDLRVDPAYEFAGELKHKLTVNGKTTERTFPKRDQVAPELIYFSNCILRGEDPEPSGREGLADVTIIRALYRSARTGRPVKLKPVPRTRRPEPEQQRRRPPVDKPKLVRAKEPSSDS